MYLPSLDDAPRVGRVKPDDLPLLIGKTAKGTQKTGVSST